MSGAAVAPLTVDTSAEATCNDTISFLRKVLPSTGLYIVARFLPGKKYPLHQICETVDEAAAYILNYDSQGCAAYHACAAFRHHEIEREKDGKKYTVVRVGENVRAVRSFWLDLDVKPGVDTAFASQEDAVDGLLAFCSTTNLPTPLVVSSGFGIHCYWTLTNEISPDQWKQTAESLKALCAHHQFKADPACTSDAARVLRSVGTWNRKDPANPRPVELLADAPDIPFADFDARVRSALQAAGIKAPKAYQPRTTEGERLNEAFAIAREFPPCSAHKVADRCQQFRQLRDKRGCIPEPFWYACLQLSANTIEGAALAHEWSSGYAGYSQEQTEGKLAQVRDMGPPMCKTFESRNPGGCAGCPFKDNISSPAVLGRVDPPGAQWGIPRPVVENSGYATPDGGLPILVGASANATIPPTIPGASIEEAAIILPNDNYSFTQSARTIFPKLAATWRYFVRGTEVVTLLETDRGQALEPVSADEFRSLLDGVGCPVMAYIRGDSGITLRPKRCSKDSALALLASSEGRQLLPKLELVTHSPVLTVRDGAATILGAGYHPDLGGILVTGGKSLPQVSLAEAVESLLTLLADYDFAAPGDKSRAVAALITPAMRMGRLLSADPNAVARYPISMIEANAPQTGKGHFQQLTCAVYKERAYLVTKRSGGVGSLDESIGYALLSGKPFVNLDNVRGRLDSQYLEAILTCDGYAPARVAHRAEVRVDVRAVQFQMTSNGVDVTSDLAERSSIVRLRKQPAGYEFRAWPEGDLLTHVRVYSDFYIACVFTVLGAWLNAGRPTAPADEYHAFREWASALGWIVERVFGGAPLLEGHVAAQERVSNPALTWLRSVCLATERAGRLAQPMLASDIAALCENENVEIHGLRSSPQDGQAHIQVGRLFGQCFRNTTEPNVVDIESFRVSREVRERRDAINRSTIEDKWYRIVRVVRPE